MDAPPPASPAIVAAETNRLIAPIAPRKILPIKRADGEAFTRQDIQLDLLNHIFADDSKVFTELRGQDLQADPKLTFGELYVNTLIRSSKCSKALRDKMFESRSFSLDFAKLALLANVGRINSTQAFFPEMRTALRTYHPIPCLQHTDGNLQDAPRIKSCLKGCALPDEVDGNAPMTPDEILNRVRNGKRPATSVVNLVFVLANHSSDIASRHFPETLQLDFLELFLPCPVPSAARARTFLWLMHYYLEGSQNNPYDDKYSQKWPGKSPYLFRVEPHTVASENVDTLAEITWGQKMAARRSTFMERQMEVEGKVAPPSHQFKQENRGDGVFSMDQNMDIKSPGFISSREEREIISHYATPQQPGVYYRGESDAHYMQSSRAPVSQYDNSAHSEYGMVEYALKSALSSDPLADSDEEGSNNAFQADYAHRVDALNRIRGRAPSPRF